MGTQTLLSRNEHAFVEEQIKKIEDEPDALRTNLMEQLRAELSAKGLNEWLALLKDVEKAYARRDHDMATKLLRKLSSIVKPTSTFPGASLKKQKAELALVRKHAEPFTTYQSLDTPSILEILKEDTVSGEEIAAILGIARQTVDQRRQKGELLALSGTKRGWLYPKWQTNRHLLKTLPHVLVLLKDQDPWDVYSFLRGEYPALAGSTPLSLLQKGKVHEVLKFARDVFAMGE
jgi:hypothetical protein